MCLTIALLVSNELKSTSNFYVYYSGFLRETDPKGYLSLFYYLYIFYIYSYIFDR